jgi:hypothetical protein
MRVLLALILVALAAFCAFGFLATFEPVDGALGWRVGYGVAIFACLYGMLRLLRRGSNES